MDNFTNLKDLEGSRISLGIAIINVHLLLAFTQKGEVVPKFLATNLCSIDIGLACGTNRHFIHAHLYQRPELFNFL